MYVPDVRPVFQECYRVLKDNGIFIMMAPNPVNYLCDFVDDEAGGYYKAIHRMPYCSSDHAGQGNWIEYGHTGRLHRHSAFLRISFERLSGMPAGGHHGTTFYDQGGEEITVHGGNWNKSDTGE